jgi:hypothetical protein
MQSAAVHQSAPRLPTSPYLLPCIPTLHPASPTHPPQPSPPHPHLTPPHRRHTPLQVAGIMVFIAVRELIPRALLFDPHGHVGVSLGVKLGVGYDVRTCGVTSGAILPARSRCLVLLGAGPRSEHSLHAWGVSRCITGTQQPACGGRMLRTAHSCLGTVVLLYHLS